jgi:hypothetical protein
MRVAYDQCLDIASSSFGLFKGGVVVGDFKKRELVVACK